MRPFTILFILEPTPIFATERARHLCLCQSAAFRTNLRIWLGRGIEFKLMFERFRCPKSSFNIRFSILCFTVDSLKAARTFEWHECKPCLSNVIFWFFDNLLDTFSICIKHFCGHFALFWTSFVCLLLCAYQDTILWFLRFVETW